MTDKEFKSFSWLYCWMCISMPLGRRVHSKIYTPGTIANSQSDRAPTRIIKNGAVVKVRILVKLGILYMTHSKTFRVIFNEMPVFFLISYWCYFSFLKIYSDKSFSAYFYEQMLLEIFVAKGDSPAVFEKE